jgi:hypothetical protein
VCAGASSFCDRNSAIAAAIAASSSAFVVLGVMSAMLGSIECAYETKLRVSSTNCGSATMSCAPGLLCPAAETFQA